jgi:hypothetical protein
MSQTTLRISFDGDTPGLAEHRLSLDAFLPALAELLKALRRIANEAEAAAVQEIRKGRLRRDAAGIDIQIETVSANSPVAVACVVTEAALPIPPLINDLPEVAVDRFLDFTRREASGQLAHSGVRKYLQKLPKDLRVQRYEHDSGSGVKVIEIGSVNLPATAELPYLREVTGPVVGATFPPGNPSVRVRLGTGTSAVNIAATASEVEGALLMRGAPVCALFVTAETGNRLLRIAPADAPFSPMSPEERTKHLFDRWRDVLSYLAQ